MINHAVFGACLDAVAERLLGETGDGEPVSLTPEQIEAIIIMELTKDLQLTATLIAGGMHGMDYLDVQHVEDWDGDGSHPDHIVLAGRELRARAASQSLEDRKAAIDAAIRSVPVPETDDEKEIAERVEQLIQEVRDRDG